MKEQTYFSSTLKQMAIQLIGYLEDSCFDREDKEFFLEEIANITRKMVEKS